MQVVALFLLCSASVVSTRRVRYAVGEIQGWSRLHSLAELDESIVPRLDRQLEALAVLLLTNGSLMTGWQVIGMGRKPRMTNPIVDRARDGSAVVMSDGAPTNPPRLLLTSSGLTSPELESCFHEMLRSATAATSQDASKPPRIALLATPLMALSKEGSETSSKTPAQRRKKKWENAKRAAREMAQELGVEVQCIDCSKDGERLDAAKKEIAITNCIWVPGGNTFWLWYNMRRTGLDALVRKRVLEDGALYVGASAGAIVAGSTISTAFWKGWDDPSVAGDIDAEKVWAEEEYLQGMGLVEPATAFFPHYNNTYSELVESMRSELDEGTRLLCLTNDEEIVYVSGDENTAGME